MSLNDRSTSEGQESYAIKTWRYLRLAMIALVVGLAASVLYEWVSGGADCWQTSISAYYYTHAQPIFVGSLLAIGTCLVCLRGSNDVEDILLNLAGMFAPIVALVPTSGVGDCASLPGLPQDPTPNVENNITALLLVGVLAFIVLATLSRRRPPSRSARIGYFVAIAIFVGVGGTFLLARTTFVEHAHGVAASLMFICIIAVAVVNAVSFRRKQGDPDPRNRYSGVALAMVVSVPLLLVVGGEYRVLLAEVAAIGLFAVFWSLQTEELWDEGVRSS